MQPSIQYFKIILNQIYDTLKSTYAGDKTIEKLNSLKKFYPDLINGFEEWLLNYWNWQRKDFSKNDIIVNMQDEKDYYKAIIYYISGMTDNFAIEMYNKIVGF